MGTGDNIIYPSDICDSKWASISHLFEKNDNRGKHLQAHDKRLLVNAVLYIYKTGCNRQDLPECYPNIRTVSSFFHRAERSGLWTQICKELGLQHISILGDTRRQYSIKFREDAARLSIADPKNVKQIAEELGVNPDRIYVWRKKYAATKEKTLYAMLEDEIMSLQQENAKLRSQRDKLTKTIESFAVEKCDKIANNLV